MNYTQLREGGKSFVGYMWLKSQSWCDHLWFKGQSNVHILYLNLYCVYAYQRNYTGPIVN